MLVLELFVFTTIVLFPSSMEEVCTNKNEESCSNKAADTASLTDLDNKYEDYFQEIENAENVYRECNAKKCGCFTNVITRDLQPFSDKGINEELIQRTTTSGTIYQIINGQLYRHKDCMFPSRCAGIEHFILKIAENMTNTEFVINTRDYPQSSKHFSEPLPVLSFSKTQDYYDIMYPAWSFWEGGPAISLYPRGLGRWDQHRITLDNVSKSIPWEKKETRAFFRGSRTSAERDNLVLLSRKRSDIVDAQYTKNQAWKSDQDTLYKPPAPEVSLEDHCKFKYLFNYRGVAASFRHKHLFLCNSLVFHVGDEWTEFYYDTMKPWIHYIPVSKDASEGELERLINFAMDNDSIARKIAQRGRDFIWEKLKMSHINCYWKKLLRNYTKLLTYKPGLRKDVVKIAKR